MRLGLRLKQKVSVRKGNKHAKISFTHTPQATEAATCTTVFCLLRDEIFICSKTFRYITQDEVLLIYTVRPAFTAHTHTHTHFSLYATFTLDARMQTIQKHTEHSTADIFFLP